MASIAGGTPDRDLNRLPQAADSRLAAASQYAGEASGTGLPCLESQDRATQVAASECHAAYPQAWPAKSRKGLPRQDKVRMRSPRL